MSDPVFLEQDNVPLGVFQALAMNEQADCWLQARTFAMNGQPFPSATGGQGDGPLVSLTQRSDIAGNIFEFQLGTDTGNIFNSGNLAVTELEPNAICLPLRCSDFTITTLEAREGESEGTPSLLPNSFPEGTFSMSSSAPLKIGTVFTWNELFFPSDENTPNPFYLNFNTCVEHAQESTPNPGDFFSFQVITDTCFIKIQILDCSADSVASATSIDPDTGLVELTTTVIIGSSTGSGGGVRAACLPFVCGHFIQIFVRPNPDSGRTDFCQVTGRSIIVNTETVSDINNNEQLIVRSNALTMDNYNDPNLGLYSDPGRGAVASIMAEQRCNAGTGDEMSDVLNPETGVAATFSCLQIPNSTLPPPEVTTFSSEVITNTSTFSSEVTTSSPPG